ncbi:nuclear transport factor 2 family protein [Acuticoccus kandeliae]|uniref:nuclear transport factor 2 family protein n=1 Tax=Acuticoccus kandeliae TaxID=2073160 RepID=UPI000D3EB153|nr:nuclear transport factor 2 family protein [Acuticoccus kandeliae]
MPNVPAQDYVEILNLYAEYNLASDAGDSEVYASCFSSDGLLELVTPGITVSGHENFVAFKNRDKAGRPHIYRRHWNGSIHLELLDDGAVRGRAYLLAFNGTPGDLPIIADCGVYEDRIVKENGAWKFAHRYLVMDGTTFALKDKAE